MTKYEMSKIVDLINGMTNEEFTIVCNTIEELKRRKTEKRIIDYNVTLNVRAIFDFTGFENLKSDREFAENIRELLADEITACGGVAVIDINESTLNVN